MTITMGWRARWLLPVLALGMVFQLAACGDSEADQRKAFMTVLQSVPSQSGSVPPALSDDQKKRLGPFANDYAILTTFSQQLQQSMAVSLKPLLEHVSQIRVPQDYLTQRDGVRSAVGAINLLGQQVQAAKTQADSAHRNLSQPQEVQVLYERLLASGCPTGGGIGERGTNCRHAGTAVGAGGRLPSGSGQAGHFCGKSGAV